MALPDHLLLEVAVPERLLVREQVDMVQIPAANGYFGVLPGHAPLMSILGTGVLSFKGSTGTRYMAIDGGVVEVLPDHVRVLADTAEWAAEIDVKRAEQDLAGAKEKLQSHDIKVDADQMQHEVRKAQARIDAAERGKRG